MSTPFLPSRPPRSRRFAASRRIVAVLALACAAPLPALAQEFRDFSSKGLPGSQGVVVRLSHPAHWRPVIVDDAMALAELRGPEGKATGILQVGRGRQRQDMESLCRPERARTMLQNLAAAGDDARVTEAVARRRDGRPAFELAYERNEAPALLQVRSVIVCLKDTQLVVSCGGTATAKPALAAIAPVCARVLESLAIAEE
jgi:hypothetical protein